MHDILRLTTTRESYRPRMLDWRSFVDRFGTGMLQGYKVPKIETGSSR